jgi:hypothetical protein
MERDPLSGMFYYSINLQKNGSEDLPLLRDISANPLRVPLPVTLVSRIPLDRTPPLLSLQLKRRSIDNTILRLETFSYFVMYLLATRDFHSTSTVFPLPLVLI